MPTYWFLGESGEYLEMERDDLDNALDEAYHAIGEIRDYGEEDNPDD